MGLLPPLLLAFLVAIPQCGGVSDSSSVPLHVESRPQTAGAPSILVIEGLHGLPKLGAVIEVRALARGVDPGRSLLTQFTVLSAKTRSWRIVVDAPDATLAAVADDKSAAVALRACPPGGQQHDCVAIGADSVTLLRSVPIK